MSENIERRDIAEVGLTRWGKVPQMLMIAEESVEVAHAILKWRRAYDSFIHAHNTDKTQTLLDTEAALMLEIQQLRLVLEIAPIVLPYPKQDWDSINAGVLADARVRVLK